MKYIYVTVRGLIFGWFFITISLLMFYFKSLLAYTILLLVFIGAYTIFLNIASIFSRRVRLSKVLLSNDLNMLIISLIITNLLFRYTY